MWRGSGQFIAFWCEKKATPFYIGCAPEYKIWYNNNNKNNSPILRNDSFFYNILNNALKKMELRMWNKHQYVSGKKKKIFI